MDDKIMRTYKWQDPLNVYPHYEDEEEERERKKKKEDDDND